MDERMRRMLLSGAAEPGSPKSPPGHGAPGGQPGDGHAHYPAQGQSLAQAVLDLEARHEADERWVPLPTVATPRAERGTRSTVLSLAAGVGIFLLAALPRLYVIFFVTAPQNPGLGWYGDTFHHWQIAYLSKEVGFHYGFLRLWDFKGMEYFWGLLHPLLLASLFAITGSVDILIPRLVSLVSGSISVALIFVLGRRYFNVHVALAAALLAALNPVGLFSDASGMQEPLGIMLLLAGIALWPRRSAGTGLLWALAGMVRAEFWVFGAGLVLAVLLFEEDSSRKLSVAVGWGIPILLYMKYLLDSTGNAIYPIYWNFLGNAAGEWMEDVPLNEVQTIAMWGFRALTVVSAGGVFWVLRKKPSHYLISLLGLGNILFLSILLGFTAYVRGFLPRFLVDRIFALPYIYVGLIVAAAALYWLPKRLARGIGLAAGWLMVLFLLGLSQSGWKAIWHYYEPGESVWESEHAIASEIAAQYQGGVISIMEDRPWLTYFLAYEHGISGQQIEGQMYDPFSYIEGDAFGNWSENRENIVDWLKDRDIRLLVFYAGKGTYEELIRREPGMFDHITDLNNGAIKVYEVDAR